MSAPLLLHAFSSFEVGGAQSRFATIANHFGPRYRHAIVAMDGNLAAADRLDPALDVSYPTIPLRKGDTLGNARAIRRLLRQMRPAALFTSNWGTIEWAVANRLRLVRHVHVEDGFGREERTRQLPRRVWMRRLFLAGRHVVVPSLTLRRIALQIWRLNPARVQLIPNGIDLHRFAAPGPNAAGNVVGTIAGLRAEKNVARLLRAFAAIGPPRDARLVVVGDGPERAALATLADSLGIAGRVQWAGYQPDPVALLHRLDVFAISSDTEQMPMSLLEAMAAGIPVASTDVGDVAAILPREQRDLVVPPDDAALAAALARLLDDPALRRAMGDANRARVADRFDQALMFEAWGRLYDGP